MEQDSNVLEGDTTGAAQVSGATVSTPDKPEPAPEVTAFIDAWVKRIKSAKEYKGTKRAFERMDKCMEIATDGDERAWTESGNNYTVPIINRIMNQAVAQLYAKNPKALAKRRPRRQFTVWDGKMSSLSEAMNAQRQVQAATAAFEQAHASGVPVDGPPPQLDPNYAAIIKDAEAVKAYDALMDGVADTLTILHNYFIQDPAAQYKQQFKALVRRTKVCAVGYVKLGFQRILQENPDVTVKLSDATEKLSFMRRLMAEGARDQLPEGSADEEQLKTLIADLQDQATLVVQEGPLLSFPKPKKVIIDPKCVHLKTFAGADWIAEEYEKTPGEIEEIWKVDVSGQFTEYKPDGDSWSHWDEKAGTLTKQSAARVWRVMNRKAGQEFVIAEGYKDYLKPPGAPDIKLKRFFDIFALVFNEVESDSDLYPPSDVWNSRHLQSEYNRARQGLREHRLANRPAYVAAKGTFSEDDLDKFESHNVGAILETDTQLTSEEKIQDKLQAKPVMQIDPKQYETDSIWEDVLRVTGQQQANSGPTTDATATESSIAENSRQIGVSDSADDIDDLLSVLVQAMGEVMLTEMSKSTVMEIVGPGAVWPDLQQTREEIAESVTLDTKAGASGRPNQAADLQKLQTAMPFVLQIPGLNPTPFGEKFVDLLDIDAEGAVLEGLPSMTAMNQTPPPGGPPAQPGDPARQPNAQGPQGAHNAPRPAGATPGPHPAFPAPALHA